MRPFTKTDRVLSILLPACLVVPASGILFMLVTEPNWSWAIYGAALLLLPLCIRSRRHGHRRYEEIKRTATERGRGISGDKVLIFTDSELDEVGLIKGQLMADAIRALNRGVQRT